MSEITSTPPATAKREALDGVARVLGMLAAGLQTQGDAAREVALLAVRAEQLAAQAWQFSKDRDPSGAVAADLATEVALFIADASVMSQRASAEAAATRDVTAALDHQAEDLRAAGRSLTGVDDITLIRARLQPILDTLSAIPARLKSFTGIAADVSALGDRATQLAGRTSGLFENATVRGVTGVAIARDLRELANAAALVAKDLVKDNKAMRDTIAGMQTQALQLGVSGKPEGPAAVQIKSVIAAGRQAARLRGMSWAAS